MASKHNIMAVPAKETAKLGRIQTPAERDCARFSCLASGFKAYQSSQVPARGLEDVVVIENGSAV